MEKEFTKLLKEALEGSLAGIRDSTAKDIVSLIQKDLAATISAVKGGAEVMDVFPDVLTKYVNFISICKALANKVISHKVKKMVKKDHIVLQSKVYTAVRS